MIESPRVFYDNSLKMLYASGITISRDEELSHIQEFKSTTDQTRKDWLRDRITRANIRFVISVAKQYSINPSDITDLVSEGCIGLIDAITNYDQSYNVKFYTYASSYITKHMREYLNDNTLIYVPRERNWEFNKISKLDPSSANLDIDVLAARSIASMDAPIDCDGTTATFGDLIPDNQPEDKNEDRMHMEWAIDDSLGESERSVINMTFGLEGFEPHTETDVAKAVGLSRMRVNQLRKRALAKLKTRF